MINENILTDNYGRTFDLSKIYYRDDGSYVVIFIHSVFGKVPFHIPNELEFKELFDEISNYRLNHEDLFFPESEYNAGEDESEITNEELARSILKNRIQTDIIQTGTFSAEELATFVKAGLFLEWNFNIEYKKGQKIVFDNILYEIQKDVLSIEEFPPNKDEERIIYRPLITDINNPEYTSCTLDELKQNKINQIDKETSDSILAGFNYTINGQEYHFSYDAFDQQNFADTANMCQLAISGVEGLPTSVTWNSYLSDGTLVQQIFDANKFLELYVKGAMTHKATQMAIGGQRKAAVQLASTEEELDAI